MLRVGTFLSDAVATSGFLAATIAIGGFLGQAWPALRRKEDPAVRAATVVGGLIGMSAAALAFANHFIW